ncbi:NlpC/P60 family protein [Spirillospora sp. NBC_00431]
MSRETEFERKQDGRERAPRNSGSSAQRTTGRAAGRAGKESGKRVGDGGRKTGGRTASGAGRRPAGQKGKQAAKKAARDGAKHGAKRIGKSAAKSAGKSAAKSAGKGLGQAAVKQTGTAVVGGVSGGTSLAVQAGVKAGARVGRKIGWGKLVLLIALPNLIGMALVMILVGVVASTLMQASQGGGTAPSAVPGIPPTALDAYNRAVTQIARLAPNCKGVTWSLLAAIGKEESEHGRGPRQDHTMAANGDISPPFVGPRLDGSGVGGNKKPVYDTDNGRMDGDTKYDHAVGPMQFLPGTWNIEGHDGNGDGKADPQNYYDATLSTAFALCGDGNTDLTDRSQLYQAIYNYNHLHDYVRRVMRQADDYARQGQMASAAVPMGSGAGQAVVAAALRWLGTPYLWGGGDINGPTTGCGHGFCGTGFDCSGLTTYALYQGTGGRLKVESYTVTQFNDRRGVRVSWEQMQPGDLAFFSGLDHVGIYMGGGRFVHAPQTGDVVKISPIAARRSSFVGAVRFV